MNTIIAKSNQTLPDIILTAFGTMECGMQFLLVNNKSITELPIAGTNYEIPEGIIGDNMTVKLLQRTGVVIGTRG